MQVFNDITIDQLSRVFEQILSKAAGRKVFFFDAQMGAGKTTFIQAACKILNVTSSVSSPTYAIINEYVTTKGEIVYHIDCYRLKDLQEAIDAGIGECLDSGHYCFIEWADMIEPIWPQKYVCIKIKPEGDLRTIEVEVV